VELATGCCWKCATWWTSRSPGASSASFRGARWRAASSAFLGGKRPAKGKGDTERARTDTFGHGLYYAPEGYAVADRVGGAPKALGLPWAQVALAWMLGKPGITAPIVGATKMAHLEDAVAAVDVKLSPEDVARLEEPYVPHRVLM
jgi:aryl-alcohol dehydrogenase-like predicted oxidoreductase